jgi:molybdate transport system ATP-binding protein
VLALEARHRLGELRLELALEVPAGRCLAVAGPSGAGKTSALRIVAGLLAPSWGRVQCGGELWLDTAAGVRLAPERRRCGYVFQDHALFGHLRVWQNVAYPLSGIHGAQRRRRAAELLERFGIGALADRRPDDLSGGERQRVALARALARAPSALLLDEPLGALDTRTGARAGRELAEAIRASGVPAMLVTHDFVAGALMGDHMAVIDAGRVVQVGTPAALAAAPASAFVADFTGAVVLTGAARRGSAGLTAVDLDGGGVVVSTEQRSGPVAATVHPSEIALELPVANGAPGSAQNRLSAEVVSVTPLGGRARVALSAPQPLLADVSGASVSELGLAPGRRVVAVWKATATRLVDR